MKEWRVPLLQTKPPIFFVACHPGGGCALTTQLSANKVVGLNVTQKLLSCQLTIQPVPSYHRSVPVFRMGDFDDKRSKEILNDHQQWRSIQRDS
jgi:hypothetical protein